MLCLQGNSKEAILIGILFLNLIKKWLLEPLQRLYNISYLLHPHPSTLVDLSVILATLNKTLLARRGE